MLKRRSVSTEPDPTTIRVSPHFLLSDFLGCDSVYSGGLPNRFDHKAPDADRKLQNLSALCFHALEPLVAEFGPLSVSYGYISPELSRAIVKYQDPDKPSHHRFDLGAAADIRVHSYVDGESPHIGDLWLPESVRGSPISLAHHIDSIGVPYSRLITYSESPFICLAVALDEVVMSSPRRAMYENRYVGAPKVKPEFLRYSNDAARAKALQKLQNEGLRHDWRGAGYPTHHGGGRKQLQHIVVSKYTVASDWLFSLKSISTGARNVPPIYKDAVADSFAAAGLTYDRIIDSGLASRLSITSAYLYPTHPGFNPNNDWRTGDIQFTFVPPDEEGVNVGEAICALDLPGVQFEQLTGMKIRAYVDVTEALEGWDNET